MNGPGGPFYIGGIPAMIRRRMVSAAAIVPTIPRSPSPLCPGKVGDELEL
jgi:hypothetical protein